MLDILIEMTILNSTRDLNLNDYEKLELKKKVIKKRYDS